MGLLSNRKSSGGSGRLPEANLPKPQGQLVRDTGSTMHLALKTEHDRVAVKTFTRWWNSELPADAQIGEAGLVKGLMDGVACCRLIENLTGVPFPAHPRTGFTFHVTPDGNRHKEIENVHIFLNRVKELGIKLVNISEEDIVDGKQTLILGLTWKLITHFSDGMLSEAGGAELLQWVSTNLKKAPAGVGSIEARAWDDFRSGVALCALLAAYDPTCGIDLSAVAASDPLANLELAFSVGERFGAPRLLDAGDVASKGEEVDARSLQTYILKLRQALRRHAEASRAAVGERLQSAEAEASRLIAWTQAAMARLAALTVDANASRQGATTPAQRQAAMEAADELHEAFERDFRAGEKRAEAAARAALQASVEGQLAVLAAQARGFDHGQPLSEIAPVVLDGTSSTPGGTAEDRLHGMLSAVGAAWSALEAAEGVYEESLFSLLTYKQTDTLQARAEIEANTLAAWAAEQTTGLRNALIGGYDSIDGVARATGLLDDWSAAMERMAVTEAATRGTFADVAARRADEGREPLVSDAARAMASGWAEMLDAACSLRRKVGAASRWQAEQVGKAVSRWLAMEGSLAKVLPEDAELLGPEPPANGAENGGCALM